MAILGGDMLEGGYEYSDGFKDGEKKILSAIETVVWYNGLGEFIYPWKDMKPDYTGYIKPDYRDKGYDEETVAQLEVIWMIAVMLYGEYGTSPRSGWIENVDGFNKFIDTITETYRQNEVN